MVALRDIAPGEELTYNYYRECSLGEQVRLARLLWDLTLHNGHISSHCLLHTHRRPLVCTQQVMFLRMYLL